MLSKGIITLVLLQLHCWPGMGQIEIISVITSSGNQQSGSGNGVPSSPCPNVFQYQYHRQGYWTGKIAVPPTSALGSNRRLIPVKLNVQLILPATLPNRYIGKLQLAESDRSVWQKLRSGNPNNPILYDVIFPLRSPLPHVSAIKVNKNLLCSGNGGRYPGQRYTLISLDQTFQPYTISGGGGGPVVVSESETEDNNGFVIYEVVTTGTGAIAGVSEVHPTKGRTTFKPPMTVPSTTPVINFQHTRPEVVHVQQTPRPTIKPIIEMNKPAKIPDSCGKSLSFTQLIAFGEAVSKRGDWPWVVAIFHNKVEEAGIRFACGGTLISKYFVLTAAHCTVNLGRKMEADLFTLYLGKFDLSSWFEAGVQVRAVKFVHWHPDYNSLPDSDLAILELSVAAEYSSFIRPACIWPANNVRLRPIIGRLGIVVGWGKDENNKILSTTPRLARSPVVSQEDCLRSRSVFSGLTSNRTFCAGFKNGTGPCEGDSGGGFMMSMPDDEHGGFKWYLRGVVSTSLGTNAEVKCDLHQYVIFADIAKQRPWISQFITE